MDPHADDEEKQHFSMEAMQHNMREIDLLRTFVSIIGGVLAGTLGCTGFHGLGCFVFTYLMIALVITVKMGMDVKKYTNNSFLSLVGADLQKNGLSFVLFWTLTYALVYIY